MDTHTVIVELTDAGRCRTVTGGKAAVLGDLLTAGFAVPAGVVVPAATRSDPCLQEQLTAAAGRMGADRFAVRSSATAEDLPDASYAGLYETYLDVPVAELGDAVRRCSPQPPPTGSAPTGSGMAAPAGRWQCWCR